MATNTTAEVGVAGGEAHGSFPPFDPANFPSLLFWLAISFGLLYLIISRLVVPRIDDVLGKRRDRIQKDLNEAERLKTETEKAIASYEQALAEARSKAHGIAQETRDKLAADVARERADIDARIAADMEAAEARISAAKEAAFAEVSNIGGETAEALVTQMVGTDAGITADDIRAAVQRAGQS